MHHVRPALSWDPYLSALIHSLAASELWQTVASSFLT